MRSRRRASSSAPGVAAAAMAAGACLASASARRLCRGQLVRFAGRYRTLENGDGIGAIEAGQVGFEMGRYIAARLRRDR
jgi:hypothetical protein